MKTRHLHAAGAGRSGRSDISESIEDDTFTLEEMRITLTAFAMWMRRRGVQLPLCDEVTLVDQFLEETT